MNLNIIFKRILSKLFFAAFRQYAFDIRYRHQMAIAMAPALKTYAKADDYFNLWQKHGFYLIPKHFTQPVPDTRELSETLWLPDKKCHGVDFREQAQLSLLMDVFLQYMEECRFPRAPTGNPYDFYLGNLAFEAVDAEILHCFVRHFKPKRIIEVGGGNSTLISANASRLNAKDGVDTRLTVIEPYPNEILTNGVPGVNALITEKLENIKSEIFIELDDGDILFIDSSHVMKIGGDVNCIFFEILPRIKPGVIIHFHDIFLPEEYIQDWVLKNHWFFTEQYLLHAFLMHNTDYEILFSCNYIRLLHEKKLASVIGSYESGKTIPASFWIKKIR